MLRKAPWAIALLSAAALLAAPKSAAGQFVTSGYRYTTVPVVTTVAYRPFYRPYYGGYYGSPYRAYARPYATYRPYYNGYGYNYGVRPYVRSGYGWGYPAYNAYQPYYGGYVRPRAYRWY